MKRYILVICLLFTLFLCSCQQNKEIVKEPVAHYNFDKSLSDSNEKHNIIPYGDMSFNVGGISGSSIFLNGGYLQIGNSETLNITSDFTYSAWININDFTSYNPILFGNESRSGDVAGGPLNIYFTDDYTSLQCDITFVTYINEYKSHSFIAKDVTSKEILKKQWRHIAITLNKNILKMFLDGTKIYDQALPEDFGKFKAIATNSKPYTLGRSVYTNFNGALDDILIYNYPVSEEKIKEIYNEKMSARKNVLTFKKYSPDIIFNQQKLTLSAPVTENYAGGSVIIPAKAFCQVIGASIAWNGDDGLGRMDISLNNHNTSFWILNSNASIDGMHTKIEPYPETINDIAYVPLTSFAEGIGGIVLYNPKDETYNLYY